MHRQITQLLLFSIVSMQKEQANSFVFKTFPNCRYFSIISILTKKCSGLFFLRKSVVVLFLPTMFLIFSHLELHVVMHAL